MERVKTNEDVLLQAILEASRAKAEENNPYGALTTGELAERSGHGRGWVLTNLHKLVAEGKVGVAEIIHLKITGSRSRVPAYYAKDGQVISDVLTPYQ